MAPPEAGSGGDRAGSSSTPETPPDLGLSAEATLPTLTREEGSGRIRRTSVLAAATLLFAALSSPAHAAPCALGAAIYRPAEGESATLRFAPPARAADDSAFGFAMTLGPRAAYRFRMVAASGAGESYAELVEDKARRGVAATPGGRIGARSEEEAQEDDAPASPIHFFDERFRRAEPENLDAPAPAAVFLPELQRAFAYWSARPNAETVPTAGMWLRECGS